MNKKNINIDTSEVQLPKELFDLAEILANNLSSDSLQQISQFVNKSGTVDNKSYYKLQPSKESVEEEREQVVNVLLESFKMIRKMGYHIVPVDDKSSPSQEQTDAVSPETFTYQVQHLRKSGEAFHAYHQIEKGLALWPANLQLCQLKALVLADLGATHNANSVIKQLADEGHDDEETLSILARTYKDLWHQTVECDKRENYLKLSFNCYEQAFVKTGGYYSGINAATLATLLDRREAAETIARKVLLDCQGRLSSLSELKENEYYLTATLGEACLILGDIKQAEKYYLLAGQAGQGLYQDIYSTRRNARMIIEHRGIDGDVIEKALQIPSVVLFTGHIVDRPGRVPPRFPADSPELESAILQAINDRLEKYHAGFGFSSAAAGSDLLFLKALAGKNIESHIVLPYNKDQFVPDSVDIPGCTDWKDLFDSTFENLKKKEKISYASDWPIGNGSYSFYYANQIALGLALLRARQLDTDLIPIAVWDGKPGDGAGGTADTIKWWQSLGYEVDIIDLEEIKNYFYTKSALKPTFTPTEKVSPAASEEHLMKVNIMAILFADVVSYSKLNEKIIPRFVKYFLGSIAQLLDESPHAPITKNTWGDALYFVFPDIYTAGRLALDIADVITQTPWKQKGLPDTLSIRISLHAGPVYKIVDPITMQSSYTGTHVSRAARIEPITPPGMIYASEQFAALAAAELVKEFTCNYVGKIEFAKGFGTFPVYHLRRSGGR